MPCPIWKHFVYGQLAARIRPDHICLMQLPALDSVLIFQRMHRSYCAKPTLIQSGWPGQGLAKCLWSGSKPVCRNHWAWLMAGCNWPATSLPLSETQLHSSTDVPDHIMQNQPGSDLILAGRIKFWPDGSGPEASQCARNIWPISGRCFQANLDWECELDLALLLGYMHVLQFVPSTVPFRLGFRPLC